MASINRNLAGNFFDRSGSYSRRIGVYTGPSNYPAGGDPFTPGEVALGRIDSFGAANGLVAVASAFGSVRIVIYDYTNQVARWFVPNTGAEVAAGTDLSDYTAHFEIVGI